MARSNFFLLRASHTQGNAKEVLTISMSLNQHFHSSWVCCSFCDFPQPLLHCGQSPRHPHLVRDISRCACEAVWVTEGATHWKMSVTAGWLFPVQQRLGTVNKAATESSRSSRRPGRSKGIDGSNGRVRMERGELKKLMVGLG